MLLRFCASALPRSCACVCARRMHRHVTPVSQRSCHLCARPRQGWWLRLRSSRRVRCRLPKVATR
eukprot:6192930-Pleurochrysis_carterae.AAC.2